MFAPDLKIRTMAKRGKGGKKTKGKTELGRKLFAVRKKMNKDLQQKWFEWAKKEKADMTEAIFVQLTRGDYISKEHITFALLALKEGNKMTTAFDARVEAEVASINVDE